MLGIQMNRRRIQASVQLEEYQDGPSPYLVDAVFSGEESVRRFFGACGV